MKEKTTLILIIIALLGFNILTFVHFYKFKQEVLMNNKIRENNESIITDEGWQ